MSDEKRISSNDQPQETPSPEEAAIYDLVPPDPPATPHIARPAPKPSINAPRMIDVIDDDVDLSSDAQTQTNRRSTADDASVDEDDGTPLQSPLVQRGRGDDSIIAAIGGGLFVASCISAAVHAKSAWGAGIVLTMINVGVHTVSGLVAIGVVAHLDRRAIGDIAGAIARMFLSVAAATLIVSFTLALKNGIDEVMLAVATYMLALWLLMRWRARELVRVAGVHFMLWCVVTGLLWIYAWSVQALRSGANP